MATSRSDLILLASDDDRLSSDARGLFPYLVKRYWEDNIPAAIALTQEYPMGRNRIRSAMNELLEAGYLERDCYRQRTGQFVKVTRVSAGGTRDRNWGHLPTASSSTDSGLTTSASTSHLDNSSVANAPSELCATAPPPRGDSARDLAREFHDLVTSRTQSIGQVNFGALASNIARWRREGATPESVRRAMEIFFDDPRNLAMAGRGIHLWRAFTAWYPQNQRRVADLVQDPWEEISAQVERSGTALLTKTRRGY